MSFSPLYTLLSSPWLISPQAGNALLPILKNIIEKGEPLENKKDPLVCSYFSLNSNTQNLTSFTSLEDLEDKEPNSIVVVLPIQGTIMKYNSWCTYGTQHYMKIMEGWKKIDAIAGVVLDIDSGGGSVSGTPEFADYIANYPKPKISYTNGRMCSAAYYLAAGADKIIASSYIDAIGSTGTFFWTIDWTGKYEKEGARIIEVYATRSTQKNGAIRAAMDKENPSNIKIREEIIDPMNNRFLSFIQEERPSLTAEVLTGKEYINSEEALKNGLIDQIGSREDAIQEVFNLTKKQSEKQTKQSNNMSEKTYPKLASALGLESVNPKAAFLIGQKTASFTEEQLDQIEASLQPDVAAKIAELQQKVEQAKKKESEFNQRKTELNQVMLEALNKTSLQTTGTITGDIKLLAEKVVEYGRLDGDKPTSFSGKTDPAEELSSEQILLNQKYVE